MKNISLEKFKGIKAKINFDKVMHKYANKTKNILMATSPKSGRAGRATPYYSGWVVETQDVNNGHKETIWNETNWQLTHLLENGHFISNQRSLGWSAPRKHIKPAYLEIREPYINAMQKAEIEVDFK